jgi:hypothetical protein
VPAALRPAVLAALAALALAAPNAGAMPTPGLNLDGVPTDAQLDLAVASGAKTARMFVLWSDVEPAPPAGGAHRYASGLLERYDQIVARLGAHGVRPVFVLTGAPVWASGSGNVHTPPRDPAAYAAFAGDFARRYAGRVAAYEIWNEQDEAAFWSTGRDARRYTALLRAAYPAVKGADPHARVLMGPLVGNDYEYLEQVYAHGGQGSFDGVAVHTDTACLDRGPTSFYREPATGRIARFTFLGYRELRATMLAHGDDKPVWMTELGWSSTAKRCARGAWAGQKPAGVSEAAQGDHLKMAFHCMAADPWVEGALWFTQRDLGTADTELNRYGLVRADGSRKPAWDAFRTVATRGDTLTGPCGDFTGPRLVIHRPSAQQRYDGPLRISASAWDDGGLFRILFKHRGRKLRGFGDLRDGRPVTMTWWGARRLPHGPQTITVEAIDTVGNATRAEVQVLHVAPRPKRARARVRLTLRRRGREASLTGRVGRKGARGRVRVVWQWAPPAEAAAAARGTTVRWTQVHSHVRSARRPFRVRQRLARAGRWRVQARHGRSASRWTAFTVR